MITCPKCTKINSCDCIGCNPNKNKKNLIKIDRENDLYQCSFCDYKFDASESMDYDWDQMIKGFIEKATPEMCLEWFTTKYRKKYEDAVGLREFGFEQAFGYHFKTAIRNVKQEDIKKFQRQVKLDKVLN